MWEKKTGTIGTSNSGDVHDVNNFYGWSGASTGTTYIQDGTLFTVFLATLNDDIDAGAPGHVNQCFANHCDWRIPKQAELTTIIDNSAPGCGVGSPCIDPAFGLTEAAYYWSCSSNTSSPDTAWVGTFFNNNIDLVSKDSNVGDYARAVRGGR